MRDAARSARLQKVQPACKRDSTAFAPAGAATAPTAGDQEHACSQFIQHGDIIADAGMHQQAFTTGGDKAGALSGIRKRRDRARPHAVAQRGLDIPVVVADGFADFRLEVFLPCADLGTE